MRLTNGPVEEMITMREDTKLFLKGNGTLPSPSQPVGANGISAEITHFSLNHACVGHFKHSSESSGTSQVCLWTRPFQLNAAVVPLPPARCPRLHCS